MSCVLIFIIKQYLGDNKNWQYFLEMQHNGDKLESGQSTNHSPLRKIFQNLRDGCYSDNSRKGDNSPFISNTNYPSVTIVILNAVMHYSQLFQTTQGVKG